MISFLFMKYFASYKCEIIPKMLENQLPKSMDLQIDKCSAYSSATKEKPEVIKYETSS